MAEQEWGRGGWGADTCCPNCLSPGPLWLGAAKTLLYRHDGSSLG